MMSWNLIRTTNPLGQITTSVFDMTNRLAATVDPLLNRTSMSYDLADDPIRTTNPLGFITTSVFDKLAEDPSASVDPLLESDHPTTYDVPGGSIRIRMPTPRSRPRSLMAKSGLAGTLNAKWLPHD